MAFAFGISSKGNSQIQPVFSNSHKHSDARCGVVGESELTTVANDMWDNIEGVLGTERAVKELGGDSGHISSLTAPRVVVEADGPPAVPAARSERTVKEGRTRCDKDRGVGIGM